MIDPRDILTVSELQDRLAPTLAHIRETGRPVIVTQRGKPAGVLLGVETYQELVDIVNALELEEDITRGERAIATGNMVDLADVKQEVVTWLAET